MKAKRLILLTLVFVLVGAATVFADGLLKMKVVLNGKEVSGYTVDGKVYVPIETLNGIVDTSDAKKVTVYKPNAHIFLFEMVKDNMTRPFGSVYKGGKYDFIVFTQIDNLQTSVNSLKVTITDPAGKEVYSFDKDVKDDKDSKDNIWFRTPTIKQLEFESKGIYTVKFYVRPSSDNSYVLIAQKELTSIVE